MATEEVNANNNTNSKTSSACKLSSILHKWVRPAFNRRGFIEHRIITHWPEIIGQTLMLYCAPKRVFFPSKERVEGTLVIEVFNSALAVELQHMEPTIIEKVASYFGYNVISRIKIVQNVKANVLPTTPELSPPQPKLSQKKINELKKQTESITDTKLREHLLSLGTLISKKK